MVGYSADDYLRFSADKETIYYSEPVYACEDAYVLPTNDNSEQWGVRSDGHWTYVNCLMYSFPPQGWKIHITSTIYDAQNVLYDVAEYLFVKSISFKYLSKASCQVGRGLNPLSTSFDLSKRELNGLAALDKPYSAVVTGITFVV